MSSDSAHSRRRGQARGRAPAESASGANAPPASRVPTQDLWGPSALSLPPRDLAMHKRQACHPLSLQHPHSLTHTLSHTQAGRTREGWGQRVTPGLSSEHPNVALQVPRPQAYSAHYARTQKLPGSERARTAALPAPSPTHTLWNTRLAASAAPRVGCEPRARRT